MAQREEYSKEERLSVYFEAHWDKTLKIITYGVVTFLLLESTVVAVVSFMTASLAVALLVSGLFIMEDVLVLSYLNVSPGLLG